MTVINHDYPSKALSPNILALGVGAPTQEIWEGTVQSIACKRYQQRSVRLWLEVLAIRSNGCVQAREGKGYRVTLHF